MKEVGSKRFAETYVDLRSGVRIYTENSIEYIEEQMESKDTQIWLDVAAIIREEVIPINKVKLVGYGIVGN